MKIIHHGEMSDHLRHLASLAKCWGVDAEWANISDADSIASTLPEQSQSAAVLDVSSLAHLYNHDQLEVLAGQIASRDLHLLLLVTADDGPGQLFLQTLSRGAIRRMDDKATPEHVRFPAGMKLHVGELSSHSYRRASGEALTLVMNAQSGVDVLMSLDDAPSFVKMRIGRAEIFVWSTDEVFDAHRLLASEQEFEENSDQYIPGIIFLRSVFGDKCWHNLRPGAGLVIDDPLLKKHYGFINFPQLLESARKHGYHVTLAFIPWNYWRSRADEAGLFRRYSQNFSICAHGCDHSNNEFKSADYDELLSKNFVASRRMQQHTERTGLVSEPLMVCPQELYSIEAMRAFADSRQFIGLVCTACMPRNLSSPQISGADLFLPAQDSFFGFPVFKRHYWSNDFSEFAMALFLGKHAILVEHHEFFRNGPGNMEKFSRGLASLRPGIKWTSLAEIATGTYLMRRSSDNEREVRFFTDQFNFEHKSEASLNYRLIRRVPETVAVRRVLVNGIQAQIKREDGLLRFEVPARQPGTFRVNVEIAPRKPTRSYSFGIKYQASVAARRFLSELRDNVIVRNDMALRASKFVARTLNQTAG